jgi:anhydro-N-acetylmuramic acid kinase
MLDIASIYKKMNKFLTRLSELHTKQSRTIIGLMSGTSLDGLDIALCRITGCGLKTDVEVLHFETVPYSESLRGDLREVFSRRIVDLEKLTLLNAQLGRFHAELINQFLNARNISGDDVDCIASHGQTVYHAPRRLHQLDSYPNATLQIGDSDHIAVLTGIPTLADFRQKHIAAGGEGAPLALYGDVILFSSEDEDRVLLNIGGIANFTYLPKCKTDSIICTDVGPGNTLIDALCKQYFNVPFDENGQIARKGKPNKRVLEQLLAHPFFSDSYPKTTGPELFNIGLFEHAFRNSKDTPEDKVCTATHFTVAAVTRALKDTVHSTGFAIYLSGGGAHNSYIRELLANTFSENCVFTMDALTISSDAKEAVLFAVLANETVCGSMLKLNTAPSVLTGKISLPV